MAEMPFDTTREPLTVVILVCPGFYMPDVVGAYTVFGAVPGTRVLLAWKTLDVVEGPHTWPTRPDTTFADCPRADVFVVGAVPAEMVADDEVVDFVERKAQGARAVLGICGGAMLLGAAGLLRETRATASFPFVDHLADLGARTVYGRDVVVEGKYYTAGPVTGCFEASLMALADLHDVKAARFVEMAIEYAPKPVFGGGDLERASLESRAQLAAVVEEEGRAVAAAARTMLAKRDEWLRQNQPKRLF